MDYYTDELQRHRRRLIAAMLANMGYTEPFVLMPQPQPFGLATPQAAPPRQMQPPSAVRGLDGQPDPFGGSLIGTEFEHFLRRS